MYATSTPMPMPYAGGYLPPGARRDAPPAGGGRAAIGSTKPASVQLAAARRFGIVVAALAALVAVAPTIAQAVRPLATSGANDSAVQAFARAQTTGAALLGVATAIALIVWVYRCHSALRAAGAATTLSPALSVGAFFIPFANMVLPFLAIRDAVRVGRGSLEWLVILWWPLWLGYAALHVMHLSAVAAVSTEAVAGALPHHVVLRLADLVSWSWIVDLVVGGLAFGVLALLVALSTRRR